MLRHLSSKTLFKNFTSSCTNNKSGIIIAVVAGSSSSSIFQPTQTLLSPAWLKADKLRRQKERERQLLERQGIDPDADNDDDWVDPVEQERINAEKAEQERKQREIEAQLREKRDQEDAAKKDKWKKWRAGQISKSTKLKEKRMQSKDEADDDGAVGSRSIVEDVEVLEEKTPAAPAATGDDATAPPVVDATTTEPPK